MSVDTASAKPSSDIDGVIADLEALEKGLDKLEDKIYEFETVIMVDKSCRGSNGWCPGSVPPSVSTFYIKEDLSKVNSIIVNVHATSTAYPSCQLAGFGPESLSTDRFGITCDSHPGEGAVLVYTMLKNPSGDGALLEGIDRAGPLVEAPEDERLDRAGP